VANFGERALMRFTPHNLPPILEQAGFTKVAISGINFSAWGFASMSWALADRVTAIEDRVVPSAWRLLLFAQATKPL
jgi:hypothetical protein